ncbi:UvrD-helicase domain-containing protein [Mobilicoccus pelagius]|uniref:RecBCD enzyme subunit RecB n=1 Tax=Mobilicoccus pelagius NBRC 104925 TaxID=1089455 RepID=H5UMH5_9MICO|nr:UvrD-helicase domain-containing protein [Mobilicoccus pelagius]GAB46933.1 exodeoxyribonuclease V beta chain [Mobilicoccus pelagius NBRC 104925]
MSAHDHEATTPAHDVPSAETPRLETFDVRAPLPTGTVLLEASAGTGKTWTIGALVTRYVAEGVATLEEMLVVTFGRAASQELRARVREHLVDAVRALADPPPPERRDALVDLLLDADAAELALRRERLVAALAGFDSATIATTHGFCQIVLRSLGVAGDTERDAQLVEDVSDLLREVVDDLYLRGFAHDEATPVFSLAEARAIAADVVENPQARIEPSDPPAGSPAARRVGFARAVRDEMALRMRRGGLLGYDDLLTRLAAELADEDSPAAARMRSRWRIVLVDEFQDTDPVQWAVLDRAFSGHSTLVLIGDPKQAIYAFRGGDVVTYLDAARTADVRRTLGCNHRTDDALLAPLQVVLEGAQLGEAGIVVRPVSAAHEGSRISGAPSDAPFRVRVLDRSTLTWRSDRLPPVATMRSRVATDVAGEIGALLASGATFGEGEHARPVRPGDVAVLAHTSRQLQAVRDALRKAGIPAVLAGTGSVLETQAAADWLTLLVAMDAPHRTGLVRAAALTDLLGYSAADLDGGGDRLTDALAGRMRRYADLFATRGLAAVMAMLDAEGLSSRMLSLQGGERDLTDLRHVAEILHEEAHVGRLGLVALIGRLTDLREDARRAGGSTRRRRLDSDAAAVQLVTIHGSKGLQYDVCFVPYLWDRWVPEPDRPTYHLPPDAQGHRARAVDVGGRHPGRRDALATHAEEEAGESLRLAYVALTRARAQVVTWWAPTKNTEGAPLHRLLLGRGPGEAQVPDTVPVADDVTTVATLRRWEAAGGPVVEPARREETPEPAPPTPPGELAVRTFTRTIDLAWRRTSYSALTRDAGVHALGAVVTSEPEVLGTDDEADLRVEQPPTLPGDLPSPMTDLPLGTRFGSLVHGVLEEADPQAPDLRAEFLERIAELRVLWPIELDADDLADALVAVCDSPLGPLAPGATLRDIGRGERLCEVEFELPLGGGDEAGAGGVPGDVADVRLGQIAALLRAHLPEDDPIRPYADELDRPELGGQLLRGYLTGSLDVVMRVDGRYLVADYKTNWLGPFEEPLTAAAYVPDNLDAAMRHSDYPLQALLYAVVLHRYLRWRLPGYDPEQHLGGVLYLYVRGMCGPETPLVDGRPCGVFSWQPPAVLVEEISALLDGGTR